MGHFSELIPLSEVETVHQQLLQEIIRETPCIPIPVEQFFKSSRVETPIRLYLKLESAQVMGSFKTRGVLNQLNRLKKCNDQMRSRKRLVSISAGNYGRSLSFLGSRFGWPVHILAPADIPASRVQAISGFGAHITKHPIEQLHSALEATLADSESHCLHPYDDRDLIVGHATIGCEIWHQVPSVDCIVIPCGGGGLCAGVSAAVRQLEQQSVASRNPVRVFAAQPEGNATMNKSLASGRPELVESPETICAKMSAPIGQLCFDVCRQTLDGCIDVSDSRLIEVMQDLYECGFVAEPLAATAVAAALSDRLVAAHRSPLSPVNVVCVLSGGNLSPGELARCLSGSS